MQQGKRASVEGMSEIKRGPLSAGELGSAIIAHCETDRLIEAGYDAVAIERTDAGFAIRAVAPCVVDMISIDVTILPDEGGA